MTTLTIAPSTASPITITNGTSKTIGAHQEEKSAAQKPVGPGQDAGDDGDLYQDVMSQFPILNGYSHGLYGFKTSPDTPREAIVEGLRTALKKLTDQIPWLGGQILAAPDNKPGFSDVYIPAPWPSDSAPNEILRVKDCEDLLPSMAQIMRAGAPISMLKGDVLTPWPSLPIPHGLKPPIPVIALQANFVKGGLLLNVSPHHVAIDGVGFIQFLKLLATVLRGEEITPVELEQGNRDRSRVLQLIPRGEPVKDYSHLRKPAGWTPNPPKSTPRWCYFRMPVAALPALRKTASPSSSGTTLEGLVSDNDLVCAFCWQRISAVRLASTLR